MQEIVIGLQDDRQRPDERIEAVSREIDQISTGDDG
jgi:hypothetical protein